MLFIALASQAAQVRHTIFFDLEPHSKLSVAFIRQGVGQAQIVQRATIAAGATLHLLNMTKGSAEQSFVGEVSGVGGECSVDWIAHMTGKDRCSLTARTVFAARDGRGTMTLRGVAEGRSQIKSLGSIEIPQSGSGTQTRLEQRILLLDAGARAEAIPKLKIEIDDVQVSHAAAVSCIHPEDLFYLQSRGIGPKKARALLIEGFLGELMDRVEGEELREMIRKGQSRHVSQL